MKPKKLFALLTGIIFSLNQLLPSAQAADIFGISPAEVNLPKSFNFELPAELGSVETVFAGSGPTLIHIQEAHGSYEVQENISKILRLLKDRYKTDLILLEGNAYELKPQLIRFFPDNAKKTLEIALKLAKNGIVSGPELFFLSEPKARAFGIEDAASYKKNGETFVKVLKAKEQSRAFLEDMELQIERLTSPYLSQNLRNFLKRADGFESHTVPLDKWLDEIKKYAKEYAEIDLDNPWFQTEWPMLLRIFTLKKFESQMDMAAFKKEHENFLKVVRRMPAGLGKEIEALLNAPLNRQSLPDPETGKLFEKMAEALPKNFDYKAYPNINKFIGHLILQSELKSNQLAEEMSRLTDQIADKLAKTDKEKTIAVLCKQQRLLKALFRLELTPGDYGKILLQKNKLRPSTMISGFSALNESGQVRNSEFQHTAEIDDLFDAALEFYSGAKERDGQMIENVEKRLKETGSRSAVVITGGFHSAPFREHFQSEGYNYALVTPKMTDIKSADGYVQMMIARSQSTYRPGEVVTGDFTRNPNWNYLRSEVFPAFDSEQNAARTNWYQSLTRAEVRVADEKQLKRIEKQLQRIAGHPDNDTPLTKAHIPAVIGILKTGRDKNNDLFKFQGNEEFDVITAKGKRLGILHRSIVHLFYGEGGSVLVEASNDGSDGVQLRHPAVRIFVRTPSGKFIFVQGAEKKAKRRTAMPAGGHVPAGYSYKSARDKEFKEEFDLPDDYQLTGTFKDLGVYPESRPSNGGGQRIYLYENMSKAEAALFAQKAKALRSSAARGKSKHLEMLGRKRFDEAGRHTGRGEIWKFVYVPQSKLLERVKNEDPAINAGKTLRFLLSQEKLVKALGLTPPRAEIRTAAPEITAEEAKRRLQEQEMTAHYVWLDDMDGVLTLPGTKDVSPVIIKEYRRDLRRGMIRAFVSGRAESISAADRERGVRDIEEVASRVRKGLRREAVPDLLAFPENGTYVYWYEWNSEDQLVRKEIDLAKHYGLVKPDYQLTDPDRERFYRELSGYAASKGFPLPFKFAEQKRYGMALWINDVDHKLTEAEVSQRANLIASIVREFLAGHPEYSNYDVVATTVTVDIGVKGIDKELAVRFMKEEYGLEDKEIVSADDKAAPGGNGHRFTNRPGGYAMKEYDSHSTHQIPVVLALEKSNLEARLILRKRLHLLPYRELKRPNLKQAKLDEILDPHFLHQTREAWIASGQTLPSFRMQHLVPNSITGPLSKNLPQVAGQETVVVRKKLENVEQLQAFIQAAEAEDADINVIELHGAEQEIPVASVRPQGKIITVIHRPQEALARFGRRGMADFLKNTDAIVLLGKSEVETYRKLYPRKIVVAIPHGFKPTSNYEERLVKPEAVVTVGAVTKWGEMRRVEETLDLIRAVRTENPSLKNFLGYVAGPMNPDWEDLEALKKRADVKILDNQTIQKVVAEKNIKTLGQFRDWLHTYAEGKTIFRTDISEKGSLLEKWEEELVDLGTQLYREAHPKLKNQVKVEYSSTLHQDAGRVIHIVFDSPSMHDVENDEGLKMIQIPVKGKAMDLAEGARLVAEVIRNAETRRAMLENNVKAAENLTMQDAAFAYYMLMESLFRSPEPFLEVQMAARPEIRSTQIYLDALNDENASAVFREEVLRKRPVSQGDRKKILKLAGIYQEEISERGSDRHLLAVLEKSRERLSEKSLQDEISQLIGIFRDTTQGQPLDKNKTKNNLAYQALIWWARSWPKQDVHTHVSPSIQADWQTEFIAAHEDRFKPLFKEWKAKMDTEGKKLSTARYLIMKYFLAKRNPWKADKATKDAVRKIYQKPDVKEKSDSLDFMVVTNEDFAAAVRHVARQYFQDGVHQVYLQFNPVKEYSSSVHETLQAVHAAIAEEEAAANRQFGGTHRVFLDFSFNREKREVEPVSKALDEIEGIMKRQEPYAWRIHGFDLSGKEIKDGSYYGKREAWRDIIKKAKAIGLKVKTHIGDRTNTDTEKISIEEQMDMLEEALELVGPEAIGHAMVLAPLVEIKKDEQAKRGVRFDKNPNLDRANQILQKLRDRGIAIETTATDAIFDQRDQFRLFHWRRQNVKYIPAVDAFRYHTSTLSQWLVNIMLTAPEKEETVPPVSVKEIRDSVSLRPEIRSAEAWSEEKKQEALKKFVLNDVKRVYEVVKAAMGARAGAQAKDNKTVVTLADYLTQLVFQVKLHELYPGQAFLGEEDLHGKGLSLLKENLKKGSPLAVYLNQNRKTDLLKRYRKALSDFRKVPPQEAKIEKGRSPPPVLWVLDPLDGTEGYANNETSYGPLLARLAWDESKQLYTASYGLAYAPYYTLDYHGKEIKGPLAEFTVEKNEGRATLYETSTGKIKLVEKSLPPIRESSNVIDLRDSKSTGANPYAGPYHEKFPGAAENKGNDGVGKMLEVAVGNIGIKGGGMRLWDHAGHLGIYNQTNVAMFRLTPEGYGELVTGYTLKDIQDAKQEKPFGLIVASGEENKRKVEQLLPLVQSYSYSADKSEITTVAADGTESFWNAETKQRISRPEIRAVNPLIGNQLSDDFLLADSDFYLIDNLIERLANFGDEGTALLSRVYHGGDPYKEDPVFIDIIANSFQKRNFGHGMFRSKEMIQLSPAEISYRAVLIKNLGYWLSMLQPQDAKKLQWKLLYWENSGLEGLMKDYLTFHGFIMPDYMLQFPEKIEEVLLHESVHASYEDRRHPLLSKGYLSILKNLKWARMLKEIFSFTYYLPDLNFDIETVKRLDTQELTVWQGAFEDEFWAQTTRHSLNDEKIAKEFEDFIGKMRRKNPEFPPAIAERDRLIREEITPKIKTYKELIVSDYPDSPAGQAFRPEIRAAAQDLAENFTGYLVLESLRRESPQLFELIVQELAGRYGFAVKTNEVPPQVKAFLDSENGKRLRALFESSAREVVPSRMIHVKAASAAELAVPMLRSILDRNFKFIVVADNPGEAQDLKIEARAYAQNHLHLTLNEDRFLVVVRNSRGLVPTLNSLMVKGERVSIMADGTEGDEISKAFSSVNGEPLRLIDNTHLTVAEEMVLSATLLDEQTYRLSRQVQFTSHYIEGPLAGLLAQARSLAAILKAA